MPNRVTGLDAFFHNLKEIRRTSVMAAGGLMLLPMAAGLGGFMPPWPNGIIAITTLAELVMIVVNFQFFHRISKKKASKITLAYAFLTILFSGFYMIGNASFIYTIPTQSTRIILGCGLTQDAQLILKMEGAYPTEDECPGDFTALLESAKYESDKIWTKKSVSRIKYMLAFVWVGAFGSLAAMLGVFISFQSRQQPRPVRRDSSTT